MGYVPVKIYLHFVELYALRVKIQSWKGEATVGARLFHWFRKKARGEWYKIMMLDV